MKNKTNTHLPFKHRLHQVIFEADTIAGKLFDIVLLLLILLSVILVMLDSVESFHDEYYPFTIYIEWIITILFTLEFVARIYAVNKPWRYVWSFYGMIDLLSILPTYLGLIFVGAGSLMVIRMLRLLRVFRILKLIQFSQAADVIKNSLVASRHKIFVFLIFVATLVTIMGTFLYVIEHENNPGFGNIPQSIYWSIVTLTTVGYGDITPITPIGKFVASILMISGYAVIAVPTGIVTSELVKNKTSINTESCQNCGVEHHANGAKYCYSCGEKLNQ